jgi:hypothetical protein
MTSKPIELAVSKQKAKLHDFRKITDFIPYRDYL